MSTPSLALPVPVTRRRPSLRRPLLLVAGGLIIALVMTTVATNVYASLGQRDLRGGFEDATASWSRLDPLERATIAYGTGDPVARLVIPSIGLDLIVAEGATPAVMRRGPGHLPASITPGAQGVAIITANRFGFGSHFRRIGDLTVGDQIMTESVLGRTTYTITEVRIVPASSIDLATDSSQRMVMLFGSSRLWGGPDRIVIRATADGPPS